MSEAQDSKRCKTETIDDVFGGATFDVEGVDCTITKFREIDEELRTILVNSYINDETWASKSSRLPSRSSSEASGIGGGGGGRGPAMTPMPRLLGNLSPLAQRSSNGEYANRVYIVSTAEGIDHIAYRPTGSDTDKATFLFFEDIISCESMSPLQLVQYNYARLDGSVTPWMVCASGESAVNYYRSQKFLVWQDQMKEAFGKCIAAFYPEINRGYAMTNLFDFKSFPFVVGDEEDNSRFMVEHLGKIIYVPRPINAMRIWANIPEESEAGGAGEEKYKAISCLMDGAPSEETKEQFWTDFVGSLRTHFTNILGPEFIDDCLSKSMAEVKARYL